MKKKKVLVLGLALILGSAQMLTVNADTIEDVQQQQQQTAAPAPARPVKTVREQQYTQRAYEDSDELPAWMLERLKEMKDDA